MRVKHLLISLALLISGIMFFIYPIANINILSLICLVVAVGNTIRNGYLWYQKKESFKTISLSLGMSLIFSVWLLLNWISNTDYASLLPGMIGIWLIVQSFRRFQKAKENNLRQIDILECLTGIFFASFFLLFPSIAALNLAVMVGIVLIAAGAISFSRALHS
ncbi:hypothetical protein [Streptococcus moroccensis]|uniref:Uncharacterized membrane protein HdeD (DUF308 family) n=1 Tax=Streptococcus moroccensis TaxID=1451356 RepID=A0ABT9YSF6_9STRE|nr:hypothetical protein [Streptococcus moroccensis]MDQ0222258.1 uncharacterized membrane protein HdeD (DUF308 family) [Streptococcus moroccensis]